MLAALLSVFLSLPASAQTVPLDVVSGTANDQTPAPAGKKADETSAPVEKPADKPAKKPRKHRKPKAAKKAAAEESSEDAAPEAKPAPKRRKKVRRAKAKAAAAPTAAEAKPSPRPEPVAASTPTPVVPVLEVVWPNEKDGFPFVTRSFTFGRTNPGASLTVNGQAVQVRPSGAFFAMVPFSTGAYTLAYESRFDGISVSTQRVVNVASRTGSEPKPGEVLALEPAEDVEAEPGELLVVRCKGAPGGRATFSVGRVARDLPMAESTAPARGLYEGHVYLPATEDHDPLDVQCRVRGKGGGKAVAPGKVTVLDPRQTRVAVTNGHGVILKSAEQGYTLFPPAGTRVEVIGRRGSQAHLRLCAGEDAWADQRALSFLSAGTPPPRAVIGRGISTKPVGRWVRLTVSATEKVVFEVRQTVEPLGFEVRFFGAHQRFDRARFDADDDVVSGIRWSQDASDVVSLWVDTRLSWGWGYAAGYDEAGNFTLDIRRPPDLTRSENVLAGRRIVLDPGHGPLPSAIGPLGTTERDVNLAIALALEERLKAEGAEVVLTRRGVDGPALDERPRVAYQADGELFVSIHNNALPPEADPAETPRGYMDFYYSPQSRRLAEAVIDSYRRRQPELADEGLHWGDLAVCRGPYMPAILTESAYMILPEQEERLRQPAYQRRLAGTILDGIRDYLKDYRELQKRSPAERAAARPR